QKDCRDRTAGLNGLINGIKKWIFTGIKESSMASRRDPHYETSLDLLKTESGIICGTVPVQSLPVRMCRGYEIARPQRVPKIIEAVPLLIHARNVSAMEHHAEALDIAFVIP